MLVFTLLAFISAVWALPRQPTRIVGGDATNIENFPFMAGMLLQGQTGHVQFCGGTLISGTAIASAARCFYRNPPPMWRVRLGSNLASNGGNVHTVSTIIIHREFDESILINDVAVVKLTDPAVFSNTIKAARLAGARYILPDNTLVHTVGWGATQYQGQSAEVLQHVAVNTINQQLCTERYAYLISLPETLDMNEVTPDMMCTGILDVGGQGACRGDIGGPVIHGADVLVGITSWGHECAHPIYPSVSVRITSYFEWIYTNSLN